MKNRNKIKEISEIYETIFDNAPDGILLADVENKKFYIGNNMICQMLGYSLEEIKNMGIMDIHREEDLPYVIEQFEKQSRKEIVTAKDIPVKRKDGSIFYADVNSVSITLSGKPYVAGIFRDITERKRTQTALEMASAETVNEKNRLEAVMEALPVGLAIVDTHGGNIRSNPMFERIWGGPRPDAHNIADYTLYKAWWLATGKAISPEEWASARAVMDGETVIGQMLRIERFDGTTVFVMNSAAPIRDAQGHIVGSAVAIMDITELQSKEVELKEIAEKLSRSNADLQQFAYSASHDLQEPLRTVTAFVGLLEKRYRDRIDEKANGYINFIVSGTKRMQALLKDLLEYSRVDGRGELLKPTSLSSVLQDALSDLKGATTECSAEISCTDLPTVLADASQIRQLFQNLIGNSIKFRGNEQLKIHISAEQNNDEWIISVKDNGIGMDPKYFDRIFMIFQRLHTADEYRGTGVGLAICKRIIERHGGKIWVESQHGKGSTFFLRFVQHKLP